MTLRCAGQPKITVFFFFYPNSNPHATIFESTDFLGMKFNKNSAELARIKYDTVIEEKSKIICSEKSIIEVCFVC